MKLYRHFDTEGRLLYVGIARNPLGRLGDHNGCSHWVDEIATITIEHFDTEASARAAETEAIIRENPAHNKLRPRRERKAKAELYGNEHLKELLLSAHTDSFRAYLGYLIQVRDQLQTICLRDLESASGVSYQHLWNIRQGRQKPSCRVLDSVLAGLDRLDAAEAEAP